MREFTELWITLIGMMVSEFPIFSSLLVFVVIMSLFYTLKDRYDYR